MGPSGSGKSSIARALLRLIPTESGHFFYKGRDLLALPQKEWRRECHKYQMIFQDPYSALNPRHSIARTLTEPLRYHRLANTREEALEKAADMLREVGMKNECVSALDPGVQARVLNLIKALQEKYGFACLFISHDEAVVQFMADEICAL